jgi:nucleotide-binding universal stress UspA family protein
VSPSRSALGRSEDGPDDGDVTAPAHGKRPRVVVGVSRDHGSRRALEWAAAEAARRGADLDVVHAWDMPSVMAPLGVPYPESDVAPVEARAKVVLDDAVAAVPAATRRLIPLVSPIVVPGSAGRALVETATGADLLVVGARGRGALRGLLGSVSHQCVHHAACPVVVVPGGDATTGASSWQRVVVGVDGSDASAAALRWALDEAARWDAELTVVHTWETPYPVEPWGFVITPAHPDDFRTGSIALISNMVDAAIAAGASRPASVVPLSVEDAAGPGLISAAGGADLLVVGSRGRGGFAALLVGSVSLHCLHEAPCPIAVIRSG